VASTHHLYGWYFTPLAPAVKRDSIEYATLGG
jgi:hypothetical protein